jgi:aspartyl/asparaginyl-tRNA synthetase
VSIKKELSRKNIFIKIFSNKIKKTMKINSQEIREKFIKFFKEKNHFHIPSASLVPENDPTVLFNTA